MLATLNTGQFNGCWDSINFFKDDFEGFVRFFQSINVWTSSCLRSD